MRCLLSFVVKNDHTPTSWSSAHFEELQLLVHVHVHSLHTFSEICTVTWISNVHIHVHVYVVSVHRHYHVCVHWLLCVWRTTWCVRVTLASCWSLSGVTRLTVSELDV